MARKLKLVRVVGARPQFMQVPPLRDELQRRGHEECLVHTGQHYDDNMSRCFFDDLGLPAAHVNLNVGSANHGVQTGRILEALEKFLLEHECDAVVVDGDTNSTLAGALVAAKLRIPAIHVEAGLRCFDRRMPEEINRIGADHSSDLLCAPTGTAVRHLVDEGLGDRTTLTGDLMYDCFLQHRHRADETVLDRLGVTEDEYLLSTVHRAENTDDPRRLAGILGALAAMPLPVVFPVHPRTAPLVDAWLGHGGRAGAIRVVPPLRYLEILALLERTRCVLTDSGGLQREAFFAGKPSVVLRDRTEWLEQVASGWSVLATCDPERIHAAYGTIVRGDHRESEADHAGIYGGGRAAIRITDAIEGFLE